MEAHDNLTGTWNMAALMICSLCDKPFTKGGVLILPLTNLAWLLVDYILIVEG
jgi:hypothetical protein